MIIVRIFCNKMFFLYFLIISLNYTRYEAVKNIISFSFYELKLMASNIGLNINEKKEEIYEKLLKHYKSTNDIDLIKQHNKNSKENIDVDNVIKPPTPEYYLSNIDIDKF